MFSATKEDTVHNLKNPAQTLSDAASDAKENLRDAANNAGRKARSLYKATYDEVSHAKDAVTTQIRTKPVQSSFIALGIGFVLGTLFRR